MDPHPSTSRGYVFFRRFVQIGAGVIVFGATAWFQLRLVAAYVGAKTPLVSGEDFDRFMLISMGFAFLPAILAVVLGALIALLVGSAILGISFMAMTIVVRLLQPDLRDHRTLAQILADEQKRPKPGQ